MRRRPIRFQVKVHGSTMELPEKPLGLRPEEEGGIPSVAVKCVDIRKNTSGEGGLLGRF